MEHTIELLEAEIDSLENTYYGNGSIRDYQEERVEDYKKCIKILKGEEKEDPGELPEKLEDYLNDLTDEGHIIHRMSSVDSYSWVVKFQENWIILIQWFPGSSDYDIVNINSKLYEFLKKEI